MLKVLTKGTDAFPRTVSDDSVGDFCLIFTFQVL